MSQSQKLLGIRINLISFESLLNNIYSKRYGYICFANVHMTIEAFYNPSFQYVVNNSLYTVADGMPIQKSLKLLYRINQERIAGMDFMPALICKASIERIPLFFYGSDNKTLKKIKEKALQENSGLEIAGTYSPPFRELTINEKKDVILQINSSGAGIVFVCLGCPKQEIWMAENSAKINTVLLGVGGAFETYAGIKERAPLWLRNIGMEWSYRLMQDPRRLFKRYLVTNSLFLLLLIRDLVKIRLLGAKE